MNPIAGDAGSGDDASLMAFERIFHIGVFDSEFGGDPLLFQHLFWFYPHPAVCTMILPGFGVFSEIIPAFARKPIFGFKFVVWASIAIAVISFLVRGHHMFVAGTPSSFGRDVAEEANDQPIRGLPPCRLAAAALATQARRLR